VSITAGGSSDKLPAIVVNGVDYYTHLHLYLEGDGSWAMRDRSGLYMSRPKTGGAPASPAAAKKALQGIGQAWASFIEGRPELLGEAEASHLNREIGKVEEEMGEAQAALDALAAKREGLLRREEQLGNA
jgi:hypothetical protein